ncbi:hypothetical protein H0H93_001606, partial [Arthromyces matolae]
MPLMILRSSWNFKEELRVSFRDSISFSIKIILTLPMNLRSKFLSCTTTPIDLASALNDHAKSSHSSSTRLSMVSLGMMILV